MANRMQIGEVASKCGVSADTLRYYEKRGLISEPPRFESSGYRAFPPDIVERVHFIRHAQDLGFTLSEIAELLELRAADDASCAQVREAARTKIEHVRSKIERLERVLQGLQDLAEICPGDVSADRCPIFEVLENE